MTTYLVTGGTGYLGRHLVHQLVEGGHSVKVLARTSSDTAGLEGVEVVKGDITNSAEVSAALEGVQRVFHTAAETRDGQSDDRYMSTNVTAAAALLEEALERGIERYVHTSHHFAIGRTGEPRMAPDFCANEYWTHDPTEIHDAHEQSKYDAENAINQKTSLGKPVLALIPTMMYGPQLGDVKGLSDLRPGNRIVHMLAEHAAGKYPGIPGDGKQIWNLVHVEDVARGHIAAMEASDGGDVWPPPRWDHWHFIIGGDSVTAMQLFEAFAKHAGVSPPKTLGKGGLLGKLLGSHPYKGRTKERFEMDSHSWNYTSEMAQESFGYQARSLDEGLASTVAWMRSCGLVG